MALGALIGAAGDIIGGSMQNSANRKIAREQMAFQTEANQKQMDFQERMSSSAYQRSMADMRLAGLNPILAYKSAGASTPGGATSGGAGIPAVNVMKGIGTTAVAIARLKLEKKRSIAEIDKLYTSASKDSADADLATHMRMNEQKRGVILKQQEEINRPSVHSARARASILSQPGGKGAARVGAIFRELNPFLRALPSGPR